MFTQNSCFGGPFESKLAEKSKNVVQPPPPKKNKTKKKQKQTNKNGGLCLILCENPENQGISQKSFWRPFHQILHNQNIARHFTYTSGLAS